MSSETKILASNWVTGHWVPDAYNKWRLYTWQRLDILKDMRFSLQIKSSTDIYVATSVCFYSITEEIERCAAILKI